MKLKKYTIDWKNFVITYFVALAFTYAINFTIDFNIYSNYFAQRPNIYFRINIPISTLTIFIVVSYVFIINKLFDLKKRISKRILIDFIFAITLMFIQIVLSELFLHVKVYNQIIFLIKNNFIYTNFIEIFLAILFTEFIYYVFKKKEEEIEVKRLIAENEKYKYNQLKSQINPHFLFNSFNVLNEMLYIEKPEKSSEYVSSLSDFYRYVLANQEYETVLLKDELDFIEHYISILTIRYSNNLIVDISVIDSDLEKRVVPMTLQILIENAAKHNIISSEEQLRVNIESDGDYIIVSNKVNLRMDKVDSTGIGLHNLVESYKLFNNKRVEIINDDSNFIVKVPLI